MIMRKAGNSDIHGILKFLEMNLDHCVYAYIDIKKYGLAHPAVHVWLEETDGIIKSIIMQYYDSMNICAGSAQWDKEAVIELIRAKKVAMISGDRRIIEKITSECNDLYDIKYGYVFKFKAYREFEDDIVEKARDGDMTEVARLLCMDEMVNSYCREMELKRQLLERRKTGMGRNYVIRDGQKLIGHIATYAEFDNIAVTSGLIVHPAYRRNIYGTVLESYLVRQLIAEGFRVYTFVTENKRAKLLSHIGAYECGRYGKMILRK